MSFGYAFPQEGAQPDDEALRANIVGYLRDAVKSGQVKLGDMTPEMVDSLMERVKVGAGPTQRGQMQANALNPTAPETGVQNSRGPAINAAPVSGSSPQVAQPMQANALGAPPVSGSSPQVSQPMQANAMPAAPEEPSLPAMIEEIKKKRAVEMQEGFQFSGGRGIAR
jgi:hypothetical protein